MPWRPARLDDVSVNDDIDETVVALRELGGQADLLLADLLGFSGREGRAHNARLRARAEAPEEHLIEDEGAIGGVYGAEVVTRYKHPGLQLRFPPQAVSYESKATSICGDGSPAYWDVDELDPAEGRAVLVYKEDERERGEVPTGLALFTWIDPSNKRGVLAEFAQAAVDAGGVAELDDARAQLLARAPTRFVDGGGPADGQFGEDLEDMAAWVADLDRSWLSIQGPPGTGKTYRRARVIRELVRRGKRVGITAMSHAAIQNLVAATQESFAESDELDLLACVVKPGSDVPDDVEGVTFETNDAKCAGEEFNVVAGTTWLFASSGIKDNPVDVLVVDEAGQLALIDVIAAGSRHTISCCSVTRSSCRRSTWPCTRAGAGRVLSSTSSTAARPCRPRRGSSSPRPAGCTRTCATSSASSSTRTA